MHENQNCPKRSLRDNTISSIVFQLDEKALCITARSHFCQLNWWSACKASITPATSKAFLPQANLMNLQTKILRSPGHFGLPATGDNPFHYGFGSWNPYFTTSPECLRLLLVCKRGLEVVKGLGWGRFGISVRAQIELALVMSTLPLPLIFLSFTCKYICSFLRQRIGLRMIAYVYVIRQYCISYLNRRVGQSVPKCLDGIGKEPGETGSAG